MKTTDTHGTSADHFDYLDYEDGTDEYLVQTAYAEAGCDRDELLERVTDAITTTDEETAP